MKLALVISDEARSRYQPYVQEAEQEVGYPIDKKLLSTINKNVD